MARIAAAACLAVLALVAAGCGAKEAQTFTAAGTVDCLRSEGFTQVTRNQAKIGLIAAFAANGGLKAHAADGNVLTIAFATDEEEAKSTQAAFKNQASPFYKKRINDIMQADGNAVMVWTTAPTQDQIDTVEGCLSA
jgi:hypothetical protein